MADQRPSVYREGDYWIIRASSFGNCDLALARVAAGMEGAGMPQSIRDAMDFGTEHEKHVIARLPEPDEGPKDWFPVTEMDELVQYGPVDDTGQLLLELTVGKVKIRCHPDGIARNKQYRLTGGDERVLEVKCMAEGNDPETNGKYDWQFSIEMAVTNLPLLLAIGWKVPDVENGQVRKLDRIETREIDTPPKLLVEIKKRALALGRLFDLATDGDWDAVGKCDESMYPCPFYDLHDGKVYQEIVDGEKVAKIEGLVEQIRKCRRDEAAARDAADKRKALEAELAEITGWGFKGVAGKWKISATMTDVEESTRVFKAHTRRTVKIEERT